MLSWVTAKKNVSVTNKPGSCFFSCTTCHCSKYGVCDLLRGEAVFSRHSLLQAIQHVGAQSSDVQPVHGEAFEA